jgi:hypothetical protein
MKTQLIKTSYLFTCLLVLLILISGCKKESDLPEFVNTKTGNSNENSSNGANIFTGSSQNPYSISNIRNVKTIFTTLTDPLAQTLGAAPLDQNSIWLYIRLNPTTENHYAGL